MLKINPAVETRLTIIGKGYEVLAKESVDFTQRAHHFFVDFKKLMQNCMQLNNLQLELLKKGLMPLEKLDSRMQKLDDMAAHAKNGDTLLKDLVYLTKPYSDSIFAFKDTLVRAMQDLVNNADDTEKSVGIMDLLEKKYVSIQKDYDVCVNNLDAC